MNCTECTKAKVDLQTGESYCRKKGYLVGQQECREVDKFREHILERFGRRV